MADPKVKAEPKKRTPVPANMMQEVENAKKDEQVQKEYEAGEKARKENMGKIGFKSGGSVGSASKRADGIAQRGKTKGRIV